MQAVSVEKFGAVAVIKITNPPMNVLNATVLQALREMLQKLRVDDAVVAVVLAGAGDRAFVAGADIREFPPALGTVGVARRLSMHMHEIMSEIDGYPKPTIAALHGYVLGGGLELALACDLRVCDETASFGLPEIKLGIMPGAGGTQRLPRLVGTALALEMMYLGEPISAQRAGAIGLVNRVVPAGQALVGALEIAEAIARHSLPALTRIKQAVREGCEQKLSDAIQLEAALFDEVFQTHDSREGVSAFIEKRDAEFRHR